MFGIPKAPEVVPDAVRGRRLTFEQAVAHVGGEDNLVSEHGRYLIDINLRQYMWKYPDKITHCTACGKAFEGFTGRHGKIYACPSCGARCEFRHVARGYKRVYDQFYLYEWRRSALDPETVVLTGAIVWRNSNIYDHPHEAPVHVEASALYVFRPGKAATVYKRRWYWTDNAEGHWERKDKICQEHTVHGTSCEIVVDHAEFRRAIEGTRIGATFDALREESGAWQDLELDAIANCARRPWLEYLYKSGQRVLAAKLLREMVVPRDVIPKPTGKNPRELLGLTEGQWYEARRDRIQLTPATLKCLRIIGTATGKPAKVGETARICARDPGAEWNLRELLPERRGTYYARTVGNYIEGLPDRLRRKIVRRLLEDTRSIRDWRDYYGQLARLGEDMTDPALMLPRDLPEMHRRMTERENAIKLEARLKELAEGQLLLEKRLDKLRRDFTFNAAGLIIRPYESAREVIEEGQRLRICIGGYAERYMRGGTIICCLRRAEEPDEPWRAVEFSPQTGRRVQDRGYRNDMENGIPPGVKAQLKNFWNAWDRAHENRGRKRA